MRRGPSAFAEATADKFMVRDREYPVVALSAHRTAIGKLVCMMLTVCTTATSAQWPRHPTPGAPRLADGTIDLKAPAPRMADGHPDFSGVWENPGWREMAARSNNVSGTGGSPGTPAVLPPDVARFFDISAGMTGGLPFQPWAADLKKMRMAANTQDNPDAHCLPLGNMQLNTHPQPRKIVQTPSVMVIEWEANYGVRQIFTDGRRLPTEDPQPWWYGYSVGRWEADTLVVETTGFRDDGWLDVNGSPLTDRARTIERFHRDNYGSLTIEITVDDPKAYTRPWSVTLTQRLMPDDDLIEFICNENERSSSHFVP
jgi:hypothetical protein